MDGGQADSDLICELARAWAGRVLVSTALRVQVAPEILEYVLSTAQLGRRTALLMPYG